MPRLAAFLSEEPAAGAPLHGARPATEERYRLMVEASPIATLLLNHAGEIELANREAERVLGYPRTDLLGRAVEMLLPGAIGATHDTVPEADAAVAKAYLTARRGDGTLLPVKLDLNSIDTPAGTMVVAAITDVTDHRQEDAARERQAAELRRSNADLQEFAYIASHDLRAPVRAISLLADWIAEDIQSTATSAETLENLRLMRQRAGRLEMLLEGLRSYSSIGHAKVPAETIDLAALVADIQDSLAVPAAFEVRYQGSLTTIETPRTPLEHVLQNLIANAIRHHDRPAGRVRVCAQAMDNGAVFAVADDGPGIDPAFHKKIFAIFQTLSSRDDCETSGVGLSIVQKTVESRGGRVWIESDPPRRGTVFRFTWPDKIS